MPGSRRSEKVKRVQGVLDLNLGGKKIVPGDRKIPHLQILAGLQGSDTEAGSLVAIYRERVVPIKTRTIQLLGRKGPARIMETLLGFEVQASYKRIQCPDMVTARYLRLFSELGCHSIRLPYDPTVTATVIPLLEQSLEKLNRGIRSMFLRNRPLQLYVTRKTYRIIRARLAVALPPLQKPHHGDAE
ncbi:MAG: hypothetical protein ABIG68_12125 [Acidobacteriota bacterium]